ncbi:GerAB/ArcD/ProY family transporter [Paenibacillus humicola]|uniref:GerAB/ArcD/ProY family transporter n=1 Tax=Paenibacillus humicola TaxID=3110540 RepID=UPI00237ADCA5|nr:GerAB/ArcD/ProY family transporter [Paenibacillus humicola]
MFMTNRLQMLYFVLIMPVYLVQPYMIGVILVAGILSQLNLIILSKVFSRDGANGTQLLGRRLVYVYAAIGLPFLFVKLSAFILGFVELVHLYIFPSMQRDWIALVIFLIGYYLASQGIEKTIRFVVIAFFCTVWMSLLFVPFLFFKYSDLHDLYPIIPTNGYRQVWKGLFYVWSSLSGPEYLVCLIPWFSSQQKKLKALSLANALSVIEYVLLFTASLLFFGSNYLKGKPYPVINMIRYLQSPALERIDIILICVHMVHYVFACSLFLLLFYGAVRIVTGNIHKSTTRIGFSASCAVVFGLIVAVNHLFWGESVFSNRWLSLQIIMGAATLLILPTLILATAKRTTKGRDFE